MTDPMQLAVTWGSRIEQFGEIRRQLGKYLEVLHSLHPELSEWHFYLPTGETSSAIESWPGLSVQWSDEKNTIGGEERSDLDDLSPDSTIATAA